MEDVSLKRYYVGEALQRLMCRVLTIRHWNDIQSLNCGVAVRLDRFEGKNNYEMQQIYMQIYNEFCHEGIGGFFKRVCSYRLKD